jgi:hypothetical protein
MKKVFLFVFAILFALSSAAQEIPEKRIMVAFSAAELREELLMRDSLEVALALSPSTAAVLRYEAGGEDLEASAAKSNCPIALSVNAAATSEGLRIEWRYLCSAAAGIELRSGSFEKPTPSERDLVSSFWTEIVQDLGPAIEALPSDHIVVAAPPGTRVEGFGDAFVMPIEGEVELAMSLPVFVRWKLFSHGYLDTKGTALIEAPSTRVELTMVKPPAWTAELSLYGFSFLETRSSKLFGKRLFARATLTQFFAGLYLQKYDGPPPTPSILSSYSLLQAGVGFGSYFEDPDKNLRLYAVVDLFLRLDMPGLASFFVDPISPMGFSPLIGVEWGRGTNTKLFFELGGIFYPYAFPDMMLASRGSPSGSLVFYGSGWFPGHPGWFAEFPLPRLGMRIYL